MESGISDYDPGQKRMMHRTPGAAVPMRELFSIVLLETPLWNRLLLI